MSYSADRQPLQRRTRCVHCAREESAHKDGLCPRFSPSDTAPREHFATLNLPAGKTCGDCVHIPRCEAIFGHIPADETCDWFPIRYHDREELIAILQAQRPSGPPVEAKP